MVTSMLEKAIEIEGLLRIIRDGNPLPETYILLNIKTAELAEQAESLEEKSGKEEPEKAHADFVMASPAPQPQGRPEVVFSEQGEASNDKSLAGTIEALSDLGEEDSYDAPEDLSLTEEDDILLSFEDTMEFAVATPTEETSGMPAEEKDNIQEELPADTQVDPEDAADTPQENEEVPASPEEEQAFHIETQEQETVEAKAKPIAIEPATRPVKLRAAFSLNDRFLYSRELFNGNMKMFDSTLDFLEGIEDYSIIEDYFYSELEWDPENSHVANFMDILRPHFKE